MKSKLFTLGLVLILSALIFSGCAPSTVRPIESPTAAPVSEEGSAILVATAVAEYEMTVAAASPTPSTGVEHCTDWKTGVRMSYQEAVEIAQNSECLEQGQLEETRSCNEFTGTWWIDLDIDKPGCNPACVINVPDKTAEINWRCMGVIPEATVEAPTPEQPTEVPTTLPTKATTAQPTKAPAPVELAETWVYVDLMPDQSGPAREPRNLSPFAFPCASSELPTDRWGQYWAWSAIDGSPETTRAEEGHLGHEPWPSGPGIGEWIILVFPETIEVHRIGVDVGFDRDADIFAKNNRLKRATILFSKGDFVELAFDDVRGVQMKDIPPVTTTYVQLVIDEIYPGSKSDDTCISEIEVWGTTQ